MALLDETREDEVDYHRWSEQDEGNETLTLVFDVHVSKKVSNKALVVLMYYDCSLFNIY